MNNVGTISQLLYAHQNPVYDKVEASGWQAAQVSLLSLMSFSGRFSIGKSIQNASVFFIRLNLLYTYRLDFGFRQKHIQLASLIFTSIYCHSFLCFSACVG